MAYALAKYTSLKPEEALIYLYDGRIVGMSELGSMASLCASYMYGASNCACEDHTIIVEVDESIF